MIKPLVEDLFFAASLIWFIFVHVYIVRRDMHWHPQHTWCSVCMANFKTIVKVETLIEEEDILRTGGVLMLKETFIKSLP